MKTSFDPWLAALAEAQKGGRAVDPPIAAVVRGLPWNEDIELDGDWTGAVLTGAVRTAPDATGTLADITIGSPTYDAEADVTIWPASLEGGSGADQTGSLPEDTDHDGVEYFPVAFHLTPAGGDEELLFGAALTVLGVV